MTDRRPLAELERLCQKPDHRRIGNWMARRIARPMALRVTRVVAPLGVTAHQATLSACLAVLAAAAAFAVGTPASWVIGSALWQLWYLVDHVDGQLARLSRTASLDGTQFDYLMHHVVNLVVPTSLGYGLFLARDSHACLLAGFAFGLGLLVLGLQHDARYKAFTQRLKRLRGELIVTGGGGAQPEPPASPPPTPGRLLTWTARKSCETHVVMNATAVLALGQWLVEDARLMVAASYVTTMAVLTAALAIAVLVGSVRCGAAEVEFAAWYRLAPQTSLEFESGWWVVRRVNEVDGALRQHADESVAGSS